MNASLLRVVIGLLALSASSAHSAFASVLTGSSVSTVVGPWSSQLSVLRTEWDTFGNGPSHTGYWPDALAQTQLVQSWTASLGQSAQQVVAGHGRVFVTPLQYFGQAWLKALDAETGAVVWNYAFNNCYSINPPTLDSGRVYVQRGDHESDTQLWSFDAETGVPYWVSPHAAQWERYMAPTIADGRIWVDGGYYGGMYGFGQSDGQQLFFMASLPQYDQWTPTYFAGRIYSWVAGVLKEHNPDNGQVNWSLDLGWSWAGWSMNRTSAISNGRAFVVGNPNLYAIDLTTHQLAWSVTGDFNGTPAVANGVVYVLAGGFVKAYDAWSGAYLGVYVGEQGLLDQPIVADDAVIFSSPAHTYVFDRASHQSLATIPYGGHVSIARGRLYIATSTGDIRTYKIVGGGAPLANLTAEWQPWRRSTNGGTTTLRAKLSVKNCGGLDAPAFNLGLYLSGDTQLDANDTMLKSVAFSSLLAGETQTATVEIGWSPSLSSSYVLAVPDPEQIVPETNETNVAPSNEIP